MGEWECNNFHQLGFTNIQLSYLCNVFLMVEIQAPKSSIFYSQSYLKCSETMKAFKQNKSFSLFFFNTPSRWHTIATKIVFKFQSISTEIGQLFGFIMDQSPQISVVFVLEIPKLNKGEP